MKLEEISKNCKQIYDECAISCNLCGEHINLPSIVDTREKTEKYMQQHKCFKENVHIKTEKTS